MDVAFECGDQLRVGDVGEFCDVFAEDGFSEERGGGSGDSTRVTFETNFDDDCVFEF